MILYFSGTGNSEFIAKYLAHHLHDELVSINQATKTGERKTYISAAPYVFVAPTYAWRLPRIVEKFIEEHHFKGQKTVYFILTCGNETGNAVHYIKKLCAKKSWQLAGFADLIMPENYTALFTCPEPAEATEIVAKTIPYITQLALHIQQCQPFAPFKAKMKFLSLINPFFYFFIVHSRKFRVNEQCISCAQCTQVCCLNNIVLSEKDRKPVFGKNCTHCMACMNHCPVNAIDYGRKTAGKRRYVFKRDIDLSAIEPINDDKFYI